MKNCETKNSWEIGQHIDIEMDFGNDRAVRSGEIRGDQAGFSGVAAEEFDDADALVRTERGPHVGNDFNRAGNRGRESDTVIGSVNVVIHRFRDGDDGGSLRYAAGQ